MRLKRLRLAWSKGAAAVVALLIDHVRAAWDWPTGFRAFRAFMSAVPTEPGLDVFVDCGKGRVLLIDEVSL